LGTSSSNDETIFTLNQTLNTKDLPLAPTIFYPINQSQKGDKMNNIPYDIREMNITDYNALINLWNSTPGIVVDEEDSIDRLSIFLNRNPQLSYVATIDNIIAGTIKGCQDGRRGYISHLAVIEQYRNLGISKSLIQLTLKELKKQGIQKCNIYVMDANTSGINFWKHNGWTTLEYNFRMMQKKF
jgi:ribosomal protein S18 acetylase RimI-like enzyme